MKLLISKEEVDSRKDNKELGEYIRNKFESKLTYQIVVDDLENMWVINNSEDESNIQRKGSQVRK